MTNEVPMETREVELSFFTPILAMSPGTQAQFQKWVLEKNDIVLDEAIEEELDTIVEDREDGFDSTKVTAFHRDVDGVYLLQSQFKGFVRESGNTLKQAVYNTKTKKAGIANLKNKLTKHFFVDPYFIWLAENHSDIYARPIPIPFSCPGGQRIAIAFSERIMATPEKPVKVKLKLKLVTYSGSEIGWDCIEMLLNYGELNGCSQNHNSGNGRFTWEWVEKK